MKRLVFIVLVGLSVFSLSAQKFSSGLTVNPMISIPVGTNAMYYKIGFGADIQGIFSLVELKNFSLGINTGYVFVPLNLEGQTAVNADTNLSLLDLGLGFQAALPLGNRFYLSAELNGSGYAAFLHGKDTGNAQGFKYGIGVKAGFLLSRDFSLTAGASYTSYIGLHDGISVMIGLTSRLSGPGAVIIPRENFIPSRPGALQGSGNIEFMDAHLDRVFPVLYKYYDTHPIGRVEIVNKGREPVENLEVRLSLAQYMDAPKLSARIDRLEPGEKTEIDLYALFNDSILSITEGAKLSSELTADYTVAGVNGSDTSTLTLETWDRNALSWDDDRKIAAFVTARDEEIQRVSRNVASIVRDEGLTGFDSEFQLAMAIFGAVDVFGCTYVIDPSSSYAELSGDAEAVDSVQFPRQTLQYRAGDCDDLSATFNALLEAVGVETAFITVPGHIYSAFRLNISPAEAKRTFSRSHDLIFMDDGSVWIPVETTAVREGFLSAWALGGREWRESDADGKAGFFSVRKAWETYEPVAFSISNYELEVPDRDEVAYLFSKELEDFIDQEISSRERSLMVKLEKDPKDKRSLNSLGVLYARYGKVDEASDRFSSALPYPASYINLGNLEFLAGRMETAKMYYSSAFEERTDYPAALLGLSKVAYSLEEYGEAKEYFARLTAISPELADRFTYLGGSEDQTDRASDIVTSRIYWPED